MVVMADARVHTLSDCDVCSANYTATLEFRCARCSDGNVAVIVQFLTIALIEALAFVWHAVSIEKEDATRGVALRLEKVLPLRPIQIVVVAWRIITQVSIREVLYGDPESCVPQWRRSFTHAYRFALTN